MGTIFGRILPCTHTQGSQKSDGSTALIVPHGISEEAIRKLVDSFMKNKNINQRYIPDAIERQIYQNMILLLMTLLEESLKTARIQFLGHELTMQLAPCDAATHTLDATQSSATQALYTS